MSKTIILIDDKDREKIEIEISQCQARVIQTLVPTILALGLLAIANPENINTNITLGSAFAILFSSSLYVASLSYKIFYNAAFLSTFGEAEKSKGTLNFELAISLFRRKHRPPLVHSETTTASIIYSVLALTFLFIFFNVNPLATSIGTVILLVVAIFIYIIYRWRDRYSKTWESIIPELEKADENKE